jgi:hypothetical protein
MENETEWKGNGHLTFVMQCERICIQRLTKNHKILKSRIASLGSPDNDLQGYFLL